MGRVHVIPLLLAAGFSFAAEPAELEADDLSAVKQVERQLERIIIPRVEFKETSPLEAVNFLRKEAVRRDPQGKGVPIVLKTSAASISPEAGKQASPLEEITVSLTDVSLEDALRYVAGLTNRKLQIDTKGASIVPLEEPEPLLTDKVSLPAEFFSWLAQRDQEFGTHTAAEARKDFRGFLASRGADFADGASATLNKTATGFVYRNTRTQLEQIDAILKDQRPVLIPGPEVRKIRKSRAEEKLENIILHDVDLKNMTLPDAVHKLSELSVRADIEEADQKKRGVEIWVQTRTETRRVFPPLSYSAKNVRLKDAVAALATLGDCVVCAKPDGIELVEKDIVSLIPAPFLQWVFLVPPDPIANDLLELPAAADAQAPLPKWLMPEQEGVKVSYMPHARRLEVFSSPAHLRRVQPRIEEAWKQYYLAHSPEKGIQRKRPETKN
jgi:hypothetical protein